MAGVSAEYRAALEPILLAVADDELIIGHRHSEWTGWAPHIEEDIAFSSIAQDEIGHANLFYQMLSETSGRSADQLAFGREPHEYRNALICERPNGDWAYTLARHFLYDAADHLRLEALTQSSFAPLAQASEKLLREERYHRMHAEAWFRRIAKGPLEGRHQFELALSVALSDATGLFEPFETEDAAADFGIIARRSQDLLQDWLTVVVGSIEAEGIPILLQEPERAEFVATAAGEMRTSEHASKDEPVPTITRSQDKWIIEGSLAGEGGRRGVHSPEFKELWDDLTRTYREEPSATW